jgi:hypothetical protein
VSGALHAEEILEERFGQLLQGLSFPKEVLDWIVTALRESHVGEKAFHDEELNGRIDTAFFDSKSAEWRAEQDRLLRDVVTHQAANQTYIEEGRAVGPPCPCPRPVRKAGTRGKTATPEFSTLELRLEGRCPHRRISPTI